MQVGADVITRALTLTPLLNLDLLNPKSIGFDTV